MKWVAPSANNEAQTTLEKRLWDASDQLRANSGLTSAQYSQPVLGLIFLRFADARFEARRKELDKQSAKSSRRASPADDPAAYHAERVIFLPEGVHRVVHCLPEALSPEEALDSGLPRAYDKPMFEAKVKALFQHIYEQTSCA
jgi:type I restriction enzyme M protein